MFEKISLLQAAVASLAVLTAAGDLASGVNSALAAEPGKEQCAGVIKAGKNDCATSTNACHGHVTLDAHPEAWIYLPEGTCDKIAGARVVQVNDPTPVSKR